MTGEIPSAQPQLQDPACLLWQLLRDAPLMRQTEAGRLVEAHGGLHHAVHFQPAMTGIFKHRNAAFGFGTEVQ